MLNTDSSWATYVRHVVVVVTGPRVSNVQLLFPPPINQWAVINLAMTGGRLEDWRLGGGGRGLGAEEGVGAGGGGFVVGSLDCERKVVAVARAQCWGLRGGLGY